MKPNQSQLPLENTKKWVSMKVRIKRMVDADPITIRDKAVMAARWGK